MAGIEHRWGTFSLVKASEMTEIVLAGVRRQNPLYVTPYALGGAGRVNRFDSGADAYLSTDRTSRELGLILKFSPTSNLSLDVTVNTDSAQVEADDQQVNLMRFSLFFPERRLFFGYIRILQRGNVAFQQGHAWSFTRTESSRNLRRDIDVAQSQEDDVREGIERAESAGALVHHAESAVDSF